MGCRVDDSPLGLEQSYCVLWCLWVSLPDTSVVVELVVQLYRSDLDRGPNRCHLAIVEVDLLLCGGC